MASNSLRKPKKDRVDSIIRWTRFVVIVLVVSILCGIGFFYIKNIISENNAITIETEAESNKPEVNTSLYYFNSLSWKNQQLYKSIVDAAEQKNETTDTLPYSYEMDDLESVIKCVLADYPEFFYVDFSSLVLGHASHATNVTMTYFAEGKDLDKLISDYNKALEEFCSDIDAVSFCEYEIAVHDKLIDWCEYAVGKSDKLYNTAYGALVYKSAYCDGYAYATKAILDHLVTKDRTLIVYGKVSDGSDHVWNIVKGDADDFYHLDVMWDDANLNNGEDFHFHGYFNLTDKDISLDHSYEKSDFIPKCDSELLGYYNYFGSSCKSLSEIEDIIYSQLKDANESKRDYIELYCEESKSNDDIAPYFKSAVERINNEFEKTLLLDAFQVFDASNTTNAITIQIFYK